MLTPLPLPTAPNPLPAGTQSLPLPHGAETQRQPHAPLPDMPLPNGTPRTTGQTTPARPASASFPELQQAAAEFEDPVSALVNRVATATTGALAMAAGTATQGSAATPMSLVAAQMTLVDTAPLQAVLAQQAATRALPGAHRRAEPHSDDPPGPTLAAPDDAFDPHAPHPPPVLPSHHSAKPAPKGTAEATDPPETDRKRRTDLPAASPLRQDQLSLSFRAELPQGPVPWVVAGAAFVLVFAVAVLIL